MFFVRVAFSHGSIASTLLHTHCLFQLHTHSEPDASLIIPSLRYEVLPEPAVDIAICAIPLDGPWRRPVEAPLHPQIPLPRSNYGE